MIVFLDFFSLLLWGILLLKYALTGQLNLLIHPNYFKLAISTGVILLILSLVKIWQLIQLKRQKIKTSKGQQHITFLPPGWGSGLLVIVAILGLAIAPKVLSSQTAMQRGVAETLPVTRVKPQSFRLAIKSEQRSLLDWIRTLNAYPEPDAYQGQKAVVRGFVVHLPELPPNYFLISRFVITCCAVDAYPVGIPVKLDKQTRALYPPDTWLEVEGEMRSEALGVKSESSSLSQNQLVLAATAIRKIPTPARPYEY